MTREQFIQEVKASHCNLRRFLTALCCGDSQLADDIAQESYIKAYLSLETLYDAANFKSWIFRIAHNTFISHKRSARDFVDVNEVSHSDIIAQDTADDYEELYHALNQLPEKERTAVLLFYMENYSIKEISDITVASQDAIKQQLSRGRKHLRHYLESSNKI